jgi:colanic acid biosynthesis glycosyl transferase WcaI
VRLLICSHYFWPEDFRINELVAQLIHRGHQVTVLTGQPNYPDGRLYEEFVKNPGRFATYNGARVIRVPIVTRGAGKGLRLILSYFSYGLNAALVALVRLRRERFDAIFVFEPSPVTVGIPAITLRGVTGCPIAFWVLDQWPETLSAVGAVRSPALLRLVGRFMQFLYARCDIILVQSRSMAAQVRTYCAPDQRIEYFPNWAEAGYADAPPDPAPEVPASPGTFSVMFAGNIGESQDFPAILDAAGQLADDLRIRWLIVGDGRRAAWVREEIARRGLQERVLMLGRHPIDRMPSFYRHAGALLVALKPEPIFAMTVPGKIQSYLAFGLPIVGMLNGEGANVIGDAGAGLTCAAGDANGLAAIVRRMASMPESERAAMAERGRAYARREFDRDTLVTRLEAWLGELGAARR